MQEIICDVYWEGPFRWAEIERAAKPHHVLYSIHGTHPLYGRDVLLYLGMSLAGVHSRLWQHFEWIDDESDAVTIKLASIGKFEAAEQWVREYATMEESHVYMTPAENIVRAVEAILIHAHQPAYNSSGLSGVNIPQGLRVFNTGKFGLLLPEVSWAYYGSVAKAPML